MLVFVLNLLGAVRYDQRFPALYYNIGDEIHSLLKNKSYCNEPATFLAYKFEKPIIIVKQYKFNPCDVKNTAEESPYSEFSILT